MIKVYCLEFFSMKAAKIKIRYFLEMFAWRIVCGIYGYSLYLTTVLFVYGYSTLIAEFVKIYILSQSAPL